MNANRKIFPTKASSSVQSGRGADGSRGGPEGPQEKSNCSSRLKTVAQKLFVSSTRAQNKTPNDSKCCKRCAAKAAASVAAKKEISPRSNTTEKAGKQTQPSSFQLNGGSLKKCTDRPLITGRASEAGTAPESNGKTDSSSDTRKTSDQSKRKQRTSSTGQLRVPDESTAIGSGGLTERVNGISRNNVLRHTTKDSKVNQNPKTASKFLRKLVRADSLNSAKEHLKTTAVESDSFGSNAGSTGRASDKSDNSQSSSYLRVTIRPSVSSSIPPKSESCIDCTVGSVALDAHQECKKQDCTEVSVGKGLGKDMTVPGNSSSEGLAIVTDRGCCAKGISHKGFFAMLDDPVMNSSGEQLTSTLASDSSDPETVLRAVDMCGLQTKFIFDPATCEIYEDSLDKTITEMREVDGHCYGDMSCDRTLVPCPDDSEVFYESSRSNNFKGPLELAGQERHTCFSEAGYGGDLSPGYCNVGANVNSCSTSVGNDWFGNMTTRPAFVGVPVGRTPVNVTQVFPPSTTTMKSTNDDALKSSTGLCNGFVATDKTTRKVLEDSSQEHRTDGEVFGKLGLGRDDPEPGWATVLRNCEKNVPVPSLLSYRNRLSMQQNLVVSPPLELLSSGVNQDAGERDGLKECFGSVDDPVKKVLNVQWSSGSETVCDSLSMSDSNLKTDKTSADTQSPAMHGQKAEDLLLRRGFRSKAEHLGLMSMQFLPKRPLSQVCSRTFNTSARGFVPEGLHLRSQADSCSSGNQWKSAWNVLEQIRTARSFSHRLHESTSHRSSEVSSKGLMDDAPGCFKGLLLHSESSSSLDDSQTEVFRCSVSSEHSTYEDAEKICSPSNDVEFRYSVTSMRPSSTSRLSMIDEKQMIELRKFKQELDLANEKIGSLTTQLNMNIMLVTSYEQNLESMAQRHKHLTKLLDEKNTELQTLYACMNKCDSCNENLKHVPSYRDSMFSRRKSSSISSFPTDGKLEDTSLYNHVSSESVSSLNSQSSSCSTASQPVTYANDINLHKKSKKNWLRKSISKAFSGRKKPEAFMAMTAAAITRESSSSHPELGIDRHSPLVVHSAESPKRTFRRDDSSDDSRKEGLKDSDAEIMNLKLEVLSSAQKIEQLQETIVNLRRQIVQLKMDRASVNDETAGSNRTASGGLAVEPSANKLTSAWSSGFADGYPKLQTQDSYIFSSPKFLHKFSLHNSVDVGSVDDSYVSKKSSIPVTRRCTQYERKKSSGSSLGDSSEHQLVCRNDFTNGPPAMAGNNGDAVDVVRRQLSSSLSVTTTTTATVTTTTRESKKFNVF